MFLDGPDRSGGERRRGVTGGMDGRGGVGCREGGPRVDVTRKRRETAPTKEESETPYRTYCAGTLPEENLF